MSVDWCVSTVWIAAQEYQEKKRKEMEAQAARAKEEARIQAEQMRKELQGWKNEPRMNTVDPSDR